MNEPWRTGEVITDGRLEPNLRLVRQTHKQCRHNPDPSLEKPPVDTIRGPCPQCGNDLTSAMHKVFEGEIDRGYVLVWECWDVATGRGPCTYQRFL